MTNSVANNRIKYIVANRPGITSTSNARVHILYVAGRRNIKHCTDIYSLNDNAYC